MHLFATIITPQSIALSAIAVRQTFYSFAAVGLRKFRGGQTPRCKNTVKWGYTLIPHCAASYRLAGSSYDKSTQSITNT